MQNPRLEKLFEFLEQSPDDSFLLYAIATEYNTQNDPTNALKYYLKLTEQDPEYLGTYYHLGKLQERLKQLESAEKTYQQGMKLAQKKRDMHALAELRTAYNSMMGLDYEDD